MHTPGPWSRNIRANGKYPTVFSGRNNHIAVVSQQTEGEETEANITLISLAPEMLTALQRLTHPNADDTDVDFALDIIKRATGD